MWNDGVSNESYQKGIMACDRAVQAYHKILLAINNNQYDAEIYYQKQDVALQNQASQIDELQSILTEERRCVESQRHECAAQLQQVRKKKGVVVAESDQLVDYLSQEMARMDEDEQHLDKQYRAVEDRITEMKAMTESLDVRLAELAREVRGLHESERQLSFEEKEADLYRKELRAKAQDFEDKKKHLERRETSISMWMRTLEAREAETTKTQTQFMERLQRLEEEELRLGLDTAALQKLNPNAPVTSVRSIMDNHDMSIDREIDCEEIERDDDSEA